MNIIQSAWSLHAQSRSSMPVLSALAWMISPLILLGMWRTMFVYVLFVYINIQGCGFNSSHIKCNTVMHSYKGEQEIILSTFYLFLFLDSVKSMKWHLNKNIYKHDVQLTIIMNKFRYTEFTWTWQRWLYGMVMSRQTSHQGIPGKWIWYEKSLFLSQSLVDPD